MLYVCVRSCVRAYVRVCVYQYMHTCVLACHLAASCQSRYADLLQVLDRPIRQRRSPLEICTPADSTRLPLAAEALFASMRRPHLCGCLATISRTVDFVARFKHMHYLRRNHRDIYWVQRNWWFAHMRPPRNALNWLFYAFWPIYITWLAWLCNKYIYKFTKQPPYLNEHVMSAHVKLVLMERPL